jgi:chromosome segregation ATPase
MTDEREDAFNKIDTMEHKLRDLNRTNSELSSQLAEATKQQQVGVQSDTVNSSSDSSQQQQQQNETKFKEYQSKIDLLENEIRYFKQQIEILLHTQQEMNVFLSDKEQSIANLNKLLEKYESDRAKFNSLLEQTHNDKQTLSRCLKQNNELKDQLTELQDAYVKLTNTNVQLTNELESERFKLKQMGDQLISRSNADNNGADLVVVSEVESPSTSDAGKENVTNTGAAVNNQQVLSSDWGDEAGDTSVSNDDPSEIGAKINDKNNKNTRSPSLLDTVKVSCLFEY